MFFFFFFFFFFDFKVVKSIQTEQNLIYKAMTPNTADQNICFLSLQCRFNESGIKKIQILIKSIQVKYCLLESHLDVHNITNVNTRQC